MAYRFSWGRYAGQTVADCPTDFLQRMWKEISASGPAIKEELSKRGIDLDNQPEREIRLWQNEDRYDG